MTSVNIGLRCPRYILKWKSRGKTHRFAIDTKLANKLTESVQSREISSEALINVWLKDKIQEQR